MPRTKAPRSQPERSARRSGPIVVEHHHELRLAGQAVLTTIRRIKGKIEDEPDPAERRLLRRILTSTSRKMRAYREALEALALAIPELVDRQLVEQLSTFLLLEDEFESDGPETRKSCN
jgi:hypothetical protein